MLSYQPKDEIVLTIGIPTYNRGHILDLFFGKLFNATHFFSSKIDKKKPKPKQSFSFQMNQIVKIIRNVILKMVFAIGLII